MTPQEKDLITTLLTRLKSFEGQPKDAEAEGLIRQAMAEQPDAPYYLVQTVLIQDLSLHNAQQRITELERQAAGAQAPSPAPTSFLGGLFGRSQPPAPVAAGIVPNAGPWSRAPQVAAASPPGYAQPGYAQPGAAGMGGGLLGGLGGGGGFLRSAAATAAGVAGGALLFEGISSMFGHQYAGGLMGSQGAMMPGLGESVTNNYYGEGGQGQDYGAGPGQDSGGGQDYGAGPGQDSGGGQDYGAGQDAGAGQDYGGDPGGGDFGAGGGDFSGGDSSSSC